MVTHSPMTSTPVFRKLSILVAAYNEEETLAVCMNAVLAAPLPAHLDREIVIVDDGSRDCTWQVAQRIAAEHPEVMKFVPCFCGCERGGHKDNHDCFVSSRSAAGAVTGWEPHGIVCEICLDVATQAWQMNNSGASVSAIREAIEKKYASRTAEGLHTPTPLPKKGGKSHY